MRKEHLVAFAVAALLAVPATAAADADSQLDESQSTAANSLRLDVTSPAAALEAQGFYQVAASDRSGASAIFSGALYGGLAGALVGGAVALIENGNYGRDIGIGAGVGVLIGAALGAANVFGDRRGLMASDGLGTTDRFPVMQARTLRVGARF
jgi:hypothetical protein